MLRTILGAAASATTLALVLAPGPVEARSSDDPLAGLALHPEWGTVTGTGGVLKRGCHTYTYTYAVQPPEGIWAIEVFISGPGFEHLAAGAFIDGYDPTTGTGHYKLCRATTRHGRFTIEAKVSADNGSGQVTEGRLPADRYRLRAPGR